MQYKRTHQKKIKVYEKESSTNLGDEELKISEVGKISQWTQYQDFNIKLM